MILSDLPFSRLRSVLLELGFVERVIDGKYLGFYHAESDTLFAFRMYRAQDKVSLADLVTVRGQLAWHGLLSEQVAAAGDRGGQVRFRHGNADGAGDGRLKNDLALKRSGRID